MFLTGLHRDGGPAGVGGRMFSLLSKEEGELSYSASCFSRRAKRLQTYWEYKEAATSYQEAWKELRCQALAAWVRNSRDYLGFT